MDSAYNSTTGAPITGDVSLLPSMDPTDVMMVDPELRSCHSSVPIMFQALMTHYLNTTADKAYVVKDDAAVKANPLTRNWRLTEAHKAIRETQIPDTNTPWDVKKFRDATMRTLASLAPRPFQGLAATAVDVIKGNITPEGFRKDELNSTTTGQSFAN